MGRILSIPHLAPKWGPINGTINMESVNFKQKSNYWRVFVLCFATAVLLFLPHCIMDAVAGGGYFHYAGDFNDQQINFLPVCQRLLLSRAAPSAGLPI